MRMLGPSGGSIRLKAQWTVVAVSALILCGQVDLGAQKAPDNTKVNKQHENTADKASNADGDLALMKNIRKAVMDDKSLSTYAHNTKIIAQGGKVTLKGPVNSAEEKATIEKLATEVAGSGNVVNQITIRRASK